MPHQNEWQWYIIICLLFYFLNPRWGSAALGNFRLICSFRVLGKSLFAILERGLFPNTFMEAETGTIFCPAFLAWLSWCRLMHDMFLDSCTLNRIHWFFHLLLLLSPRRLLIPFGQEREYNPCHSWGICGTLSGSLVSWVSYLSAQLFWMCQASMMWVALWRDLPLPLDIHES